MRTAVAALAALFALASPAARAATLNLGDPAPALDVGGWVRGEPVKQLEKGKVYVVELWATWCSSCRGAIPHLAELSKAHADVTFIAVAVAEKDDAKVAPFVKEVGPHMTYPVAVDNKAADAKGAMFTAWLKASPLAGIPAAFVVDREGRVAWMGEPADMDKPLAEVVAGTYDVRAAAARVAERRAVEEEALKRVAEPFEKGRTDEALAAVEAMIQANPRAKADLLPFKVDILLRRKDVDGAYRAMDEIVATPDASANQLNLLAWVVLTARPFEGKRDADRAAAWAARAVGQRNGKDPDALDTLARAYAVKGDWDQAVQTQQKAIDALVMADDKDRGGKALAAYREKKVPVLE